MNDLIKISKTETEFMFEAMRNMARRIGLPPVFAQRQLGIPPLMTEIDLRHRQLSRQDNISVEQTLSRPLCQNDDVESNREFYRGKRTTLARVQLTSTLLSSSDYFAI